MVAGRASRWRRARSEAVAAVVRQAQNRSIAWRVVKGISTLQNDQKTCKVNHR